MARRLLGIAASALIIGGCAPSSHTAGLPRPTFTGPVVAKAPYVPPTLAVAPKAAKAVAPVRSANVPAAWVPLSTAERRKWNWIVIHHSATPTGGVVAFDKAHRAKGWDGVGYHFVIGNGTDTADGQVEVSPRWPVQKHGAHAKTPDNQYNDHGIGICLVGNFDETRPSAKQLAALETLVAYLADTYQIRQTSIVGHKMTGKSTDCPGNNMDVLRVRRDVSRMRRTSLVEETQTDEAGELMRTASR
ncbi:MAG TPA: peptidoglycan recognition family protein [Tepidisphaeraceae bacterium]|jgi:N-acetyl-anhydromuramyl-L-alanine amidase AmpD